MGSHGWEKSSWEPFRFPYLLHVEKDGGKYVVVSDEEELNTQPDLLDHWSGIVLQAEAPESIEDDSNREYLMKEKADRFASGLLLISVFTMIAVNWAVSFSWATLFMLATVFAGTLLGYLLVAKDLGVKYDAVESFCNTGKKTNCDRVLRSDEAALFGRFSLSDAVLSYFTAQLIAAGLLIPLAGSAAPLWWALASHRRPVAAGGGLLPLAARHKVQNLVPALPAGGRGACRAGRAVRVDGCCGRVWPG
jgi:hypothetical protein